MDKIVGGITRLLALPTHESAVVRDDHFRSY